jgi:hypothetical protein
MITVNKIDNGLDYASSRLHVEITNDARFFTVYDVIADKPFATITRPMVLDRNGRWECATTDGKVFARAYGQRHAFNMCNMQLKAMIKSGQVI